MSPVRYKFLLILPLKLCYLRKRIYPMCYAKHTLIRHTKNVLSELYPQWEAFYPKQFLKQIPRKNLFDTYALVNCLIQNIRMYYPTYVPMRNIMRNIYTRNITCHRFSIGNLLHIKNYYPKFGKMWLSKVSYP